MTSVSIKNEESYVIPPTTVYLVSSGQLTENERKCLELQSPEEQFKSKFDLPVEFHPKEYELWLENTQNMRTRRKIQLVNDHKNFGKYILSQKTSIMFLCENKKPDRLSKFEFLKKSVLSQALDQRTNFAAIRHMAIQLLRSSTLTKLNVIAENVTCSNMLEIPHKLFSWATDEYYHRRDLPNTLWLDAYERDFKDCLQTQKYKCDLKEICRYLDIILCGALSEDKDFSFEYQVVQPLEDASDLLSVYPRLKAELEENRQFVIDLRSQYDAAAASNAAAEEMNRANLMDMIADVNMLHPIQYRYQKGWYEAQVDQIEMQQDQLLEKLTKNVADWHFKILEENTAVQNSLNMYYSEIEYYKTEINEFNAKFESEFDDLENAINYKKMSMNKLELQRKFCEEQIDYMREKIAECQVQKKLEYEARLQMARQEAEANLLKLVKEEEKRKKREQKKQKNNKKKK